MQADIENFIESDMEKQSFTWRGETYYCVASPYKSGAALEPGGFAVDSPMTFTVRLNQFTDNLYPEYKDVIRYAGEEFFILQSNVYSNKAAIRIECVNAKYMKR